MVPTRRSNSRSMSPPPPPAPPPPLNPWANRTPINVPALISKSIWPHRLLHVESMTSYVKQGQDVYNGIKAPRYNVLSYTWGYYQDKSEPPLVVHGLDWAVPGIETSHFKVQTFHRALLAAAKGIKHQCEWLWVDIACIPQVHVGETEEAKTIRDQEIGRQVEIFHRAEEAFAWFSSLKKSDLIEGHKSLATVESITEHMNIAFHGFDNPQDATDFLNELEDKVQSFERWMSRILNHPWLMSLWTLQEMVLRSDACVLFDDGILDINKTDRDMEADDKTASKISPWRFTAIKSDAWFLRGLLSDWSRIKALERAETTALSDEARPWKGEVSTIMGRLQCLLDQQVQKGLTALKVEMPNTAYSMAQYRRVTRPTDRIFGIMQIYGIVCNPKPRGRRLKSKLCALEDDFGRNLVARSPVISQLFVHTLDKKRPRRSWLIQQLCKADDPFWQAFASDSSPIYHFTKFEIVERSRIRGSMAVKFHGKSWDLRAFVEASSPLLAKNPPEVQEQLFMSSKRGHPERYRGLMLDYHVSSAILGRIVDYFDDHDSMSNAVQLLHKAFCGASQSCANCTTFKVALLGSGTTGHKTPVVDYIGLVLVSRTRKYKLRTIMSSMKNIIVDHHLPKSTDWVRIGLMRWTEIYRNSPESEEHFSLPPYHDIECVII